MADKMAEVVVVIVGAGPAGLATSACLNLHSIPNVVLEKEDSCISLWRNRAYDRLNLHLAKEFCELPHLPYPPNSPTFISKDEFIKYVDSYVSQFCLSPRYCRLVKSACYYEAKGSWSVLVKNTQNGEEEEYVSQFLVVATGENGEGFVPSIPGLETFKGEFVHSNQYKNGLVYEGKRVLVVGSGNSGMEIAFDLSNHGAATSIIVRGPVHVLTREIVHLGMVMLKYLPYYIVDAIIQFLGKLKYGNLSKYGIHRPSMGPFHMKAVEGRSPVIDVGTVRKIKSGEIQVLPALESVMGSTAIFENGKSHEFDAIVFATGYVSKAKSWLKDDEDLLNEDGLPKKSFPHHWKGKNGLYCAGLARRGLFGISIDAQNIANDIKISYNEGKRNNSCPQDRKPIPITNFCN